MQYAMTISTQRNAFLDFLHCCSKASIGYKPIDTLLVFTTNHVMEIYYRWVLHPTLATFLRRLELVPDLLLPAFVYRRALYVRLSILFVVALFVYSLLELSYFRVLVWH
jgi:hypothetical protein